MACFMVSLDDQACSFADVLCLLIDAHERLQKNVDARPVTHFQFCV